MADWHPIRVVARRTGLSPHVIRAWEKRYRAVSPQRTPTNRRVYSSEDVERLTLLRRATLGGRSIGQIAGLSTEELRGLVAEDEAAQGSAPSAPAEVTWPQAEGGQLLESCLAAARRLDPPALQAALDRASVSLSRPQLMEEVIVPLMHRLGDAWKEGSVRVAHEHLATAVVRSFAGNLNGAFGVPPSAPRILVTTPAGQVHEIGALLVAATAASHGWRTTYLGPSLPAEEIAAAAEQGGARAIALSIVYPLDDPHLAAELARLRQLVGPGVDILVGGRGSASYRATLESQGMRHVQELTGLPELLDELRARPLES